MVDPDAARGNSGRGRAALGETATVNTGRCPECGFDDAQWTDRDTVTTAGALDALMAPYLTGIATIDASLAGLAELAAVARAEATRGRVSGPTLHRFQHQLHESARARHRAGDGMTTTTGRVAHLNIGAGGVPKGPVDAFSVTWSGPTGDRQHTRRHHGRPFQALCLWSLDVIESLQAEGHPIGPGSAGENVTVAGVDWAALRPGVILTVGSVRAGISSYAIPCSQNRAWFADGDFNRIRHDRHPGASRLYATVLQPGDVVVGDPVIIEPND